MSTTETALAYNYLYSTLAGDTTLAGYAPGGVWRALAPPGTATPFVVFNFQAGSEALTLNAYRVMSNQLFQVKVSGPATGMTALVQAASRLDDLLRLSSGTPSGGLVLSCYRETPVAMDELVSGVLWSNLGGLYRLLITQS